MSIGCLIFSTIVVCFIVLEFIEEVLTAIAKFFDELGKRL